MAKPPAVDVCSPKGTTQHIVNTVKRQIAKAFHTGAKKLSIFEIRFSLKCPDFSEM